MTPAASEISQKAWKLVNSWQQHFAALLMRFDQKAFHQVSWLRDQGTHGGGQRLVAPENSRYNRASINISQVHYDDLNDKKLAAATALSTIVHPQHPFSPSLHLHVSLTELKQEQRYYWRLMADLNPSNPLQDQREDFAASLKMLTGEHFDYGCAQGDTYFYIPALKRHRGVCHFYLEEFRMNTLAEECAFSDAFVKGVTEKYVDLIDLGLKHPAGDAARQNQLAYHTLYFFQVLTLDRGTIFGILVHDQNDEGIMGSLPAVIDRELLASWRSHMPEPQRPLLDTITGALPATPLCPIDKEVKVRLAQAIRTFYRDNLELQKYLARAAIKPPTTANHLD